MSIAFNDSNRESVHMALDRILRTYCRQEKWKALILETENENHETENTESEEAFARE